MVWGFFSFIVLGVVIRGGAVLDDMDIVLLPSPFSLPLLPSLPELHIETRILSSHVSMSV